MGLIDLFLTLRLLWVIFSGACVQMTPVEDVIFDSVKLNKLQWTSVPPKAWEETRMTLGFQSEQSIYQACNTNNKLRTLWTRWISSRDANYLFLDIQFTQESQAPEPLSELAIHLLESNSPEERYLPAGSGGLHKLTAPPFSKTASVAEIKRGLYHVPDLPMGRISQKGFHLGFSYSGSCALLTSVRLYQKKCPSLVRNQTEFREVPGGTPRVRGGCVDGAVEVAAPVRECQSDGEWGPLEGYCECAAGYQEEDGSCQACRMGSFKPANESGHCRSCPPNSKTQRDAAAECECEQGFGRLQTDPPAMGCTKVPSAPVNVSFHWLSNTALILQWGAPSDLGGREEVTYDIECVQKDGESESALSRCEEGLLILPASKGLNSTSANLTNLDPHRIYHLTIRASNALSAKLSYTTFSHSITIYRWKPLRITSPSPDAVSMPQQTLPLSQVLMAGCLGGGLLVVVLVGAALCLVRNSHRKPREGRDVPLLPLVTYRHAMELESTAPQDCVHAPPAAPSDHGRNVASDELFSGIRDVLVNRNKLTLGKELGRGEFGAVFEGTFSPQVGEDVKVAVKTMRVGIHCQEDLQSFLKEAEIMQHFKHENVVKLLGVALEQEQDSATPVPLVILPLMQHGDLRRFLIATRNREIPMCVPPQSLLRFMMDIAAGMEYLGSQGFIHRDLAARNCMLGDDLRVRVADFGLSRNIYSGNYYRQRVANRMPIKWMAIESLSESVFTCKSDVWSFGVTMWEIMSRGRTPYPGAPNHELLDLLESGHRLKQGEWDSKLHDVMLSCWRVDPLQRPDFTQLGQTLRALWSDLLPLDRTEEAHYINLGLEVANQGGALGNIYLPLPLASSSPQKEEEGEDEREGYLLSICMSTAEGHGV